jgi:Arc/MetJ family transcription regulator
VEKVISFEGCGSEEERRMARTVIDLDDEIVEQAMRVYGMKTKAAAVRAAMEEGVKLRLRRELFDAMDEGEFEDVFAEIRSRTGPRNADGSLKRDGGTSAA